VVGYTAQARACDRHVQLHVQSADPADAPESASVNNTGNGGIALVVRRIQASATSASAPERTAEWLCQGSTSAGRCTSGNVSETASLEFLKATSDPSQVSNSFSDASCECIPGSCRCQHRSVAGALPTTTFADVPVLQSAHSANSICMATHGQCLGAKPATGSIDPAVLDGRRACSIDPTIGTYQR
jgi:hypothetical protein